MLLSSNRKTQHSKNSKCLTRSSFFQERFETLVSQETRFLEYGNKCVLK